MDSNIQDYLQEITATKAEATVQNVTEHLTRFDAFLKGREFSRRNAVGFLLCLKATGFAPSSVSAHQSSLKTFYGWLALNGVIPLHCMATNAITRYRSHARPHSFPITVEEYEVIKDHCLDIRMKAWWYRAVVVAWNTGLRLKDIAYLRGENVNLAEKKITITPSKTKRLNKTIEVPILPELFSLLSLLAPLPDDYLLPEMAASYDAAGNKNLSVTFGRILQACGIRGKSWHSFRHAFVSRALTADVPIPILSSITGQTMAVIQRYMHIVNFDRKTEALSQMVST